MKGALNDWERVSYSAGCQDHCGLFFPGINKLDFDGRNWPSTVTHLNDTSDPVQSELFKWLESVLYIVKVPFIARPEGYNSQKINKVTDESIPIQQRRNMVRDLSIASDTVWKGLISQNASLLGRGLSDTMKAWKEMLPYTVDPFLNDPVMSKKLLDFWTKYDAPHTSGCLFSGAGGGYLMIISETPIEGAEKISINHDPICRPCPSDSLASAPRPFA